jgi:hypothetical protein
MQTRSYIQYLLKYTDEVRRRQAISPRVFQILPTVSHYVIPFYSALPLPHRTETSLMLLTNKTILIVVILV